MAVFPNGYSAKLANLKCFGTTSQGFDSIRLLNFIIGRNNSGKSALIDLVQALCNIDISSFERGNWHKGQEPKVTFEFEVVDEMVQRVFSTQLRRGDFPGYANYYEFGKQLIGSKITAELKGRSVAWNSLTTANGAHNYFDEVPDGKKREYGTNLVAAFTHPLRGLTFRSLAAERDIRPEVESPDIKLSSNGIGATNAIRKILNVVGHDIGLIERRLLHAVNSVFAPDISFTRIITRQLTTGGAWEIFLEEANKGQIPLSSSGSGVKTVILVLLMTQVIPAIDNVPLERTVLAFEELENNLHPALLRRLLSHIAEIARQHDCTTFITTHSNVVIDMFAREQDAQLIHVTHDGHQATCTTVVNYGHSCAVLDDLDVRPSDLLQANGIIWVEGPSDRTYINHWINLWSEGRLVEGRHYQCVFYGGALNSHLSALDPDEVDKRVSLLRVARNMCFVVDSDRDFPEEPLKYHVVRIRAEVAAVNGMMWITAGREIENYLPRSAFDSMFGWNSPAPESPFESAFAYMDRMEPERGRKSGQTKPAFAQSMKSHLTMDNSRGVLDLNEKMTSLCETIRRWNGGH